MTRRFVIGRGYVEAVSPESVAVQWDKAFAAARTQPGMAKALATPHQRAVAASWDCAFAKIAAQRAGRL